MPALLHSSYAEWALAFPAECATVRHGAILPRMEAAMTTFTKVWALQSDATLQVGSVVQVSLKSGETKAVKVGPMIGESRGKFLYAPAGDTA